MTSRMTSKGQVTVPKEVRRRLGLKAGDQVEFVTRNGKTVLQPARNEENPFRRYKGALKGLSGTVRASRRWTAQLRDSE